MKIHNRLLSILIQISLLLLMGCIDSNNKDRMNKIESTVIEFHGKKIVFPDSIYAYHNDTISLMNSTIFNNEKLKLLTFISGECSPCIQQLYEWESFYLELEKHCALQLFFIIQSVDHSHFLQMFKQEIPYNYTLLFDPYNDFFKNNKFPTEKVFQTVLLNVENEIIIMGNPLYNKELQELYINLLKNTCYEKK